MKDHKPNNSAFSNNAAIASFDTHPDTAMEDATPDANPAGAHPTENVAPGIQPIADFLPKDASNLSHPTPPPEKSLTTGAADVDVDMPSADGSHPSPEESAQSQGYAQTSAHPSPTPVSAEQSLVRPREDDAEDERASKRTRVNAELPGPLMEGSRSGHPSTTTVAEDVTSSFATAGGESIAPSGPNTSNDVLTDSPEPLKLSAADDKTATSLRPDEDAVQTESAPVKARVQSDEHAHSEVIGHDTVDQHAPADASQAKLSPVGAPLPPAEASSEALAKPSAEEPTAAPTTSTTASQPASNMDPPSTSTSAQPSQAKYSTEPLTECQKDFLVEKMKNLKKVKNSVPFLKPVDPVALNLPRYPEIIKNPMDLSTMDSKLKEGKYTSVQNFVDDFDLIISNARTFNGDHHEVTMCGKNMEAYFRRMMETVPTPDMKPPVKGTKYRSPSIAAREAKRREPRAVQVAPAPQPKPAQAQGPTRKAVDKPFALQSDGTPQIRRQSTANRPARTIKPPQNREIPYAKPKRKQHMLELKFCEKVLDEIQSPKYGTVNHVFLTPVDPVVLNIPNYRQVIKHPMDLGTMSQKIKTGQYATATEFRKDFDLMISNCKLFNPVGNPVRELGIQLEREFDVLWAEKEKWQKSHGATSRRASSASVDEDSAVEDDDEPSEHNEHMIQRLQNQLAAIQTALSNVTSKSGKSKKTKSTKAGGNKKSSLSTAGPKAGKKDTKPAKPKKERLIDYDEKQEISEAVAKMNETQVTGLTEIITGNCAKYRDMDEMELEIDDLPNNVQLLLLKYVRGLFGKPKTAAAREPSPDDIAAQDDDDFQPKRRGTASGGGGGGRGSGGGGGGSDSKRRKHAPMSGREQQDTMRALENKLAQFSNAATSGSESPGVTVPVRGSASGPAAAAPESSGDDESEESEEE